MNIRSTSKKIIADKITPVSLFLAVRERTHQVLLLESSAYASKEGNHSFICFDSLAQIQIDNDGMLSSSFGVTKDAFDISDEIQEFMASIQITHDEESYKFNGIFGYSTFDAVQYFEDITFDRSKDEQLTPHLRYDFFRYIYIFDHHYNQLTLVENLPEGEESKIDDLLKIIQNQNISSYQFAMVGEESSPLTDEDYKNMVRKAKQHCKRGDTFQMVLSRRYTQAFKGDEFNVYRALRAINPSPYMYYFEYGNYKIFGSSPEAQIKIEGASAEIHPIAGTFRRTGDKTKDIALAEKLANDPKETAEHVMLVDLARNDLSISTKNVEVTKYMDKQFFSHVIHLTSVVEGQVPEETSNFQVFADTFPAGTLSGAPKYKAMELINSYEPHSRNFYGGGLGIIQFNGNLNHAIIIRSFLSKNKQLYYQAGAGLVIKSDEASEVQEVKNKLAALKKALVLAEEI